MKTLDGGTLFSAIQAGRSPRTILFTSGTEFYTECEVEDCQEGTCRAKELQRSLARAPLVSTSEVRFDREVIRFVRPTFILNPRRISGTIRKVSEESVPSTHGYELDENLERVIDAESRRMCQRGRKRAWLCRLVDCYCWGRWYREGVDFQRTTFGFVTCVEPAPVL